MSELPQLSGVDWGIIVVLSLSTLLSLWRGFVREALSLLGWVAAFLVAHLFVDELALQLSVAIANVTGRYIAAYAILFVSTLVVLPWWLRWSPAWSGRRDSACWTAFWERFLDLHEG